MRPAEAVPCWFLLDTWCVNLGQSSSQRRKQPTNTALQCGGYVECREFGKYKRERKIKTSWPRLACQLQNLFQSIPRTMLEMQYYTTDLSKLMIKFPIVLYTFSHLAGSRVHPTKRHLDCYLNFQQVVSKHANYVTSTSFLVSRVELKTNTAIGTFKPRDQNTFNTHRCLNCCKGSTDKSVSMHFCRVFRNILKRQVLWNFSVWS